MRTFINLAAPLITFLLLVSVGIELTVDNLQRVWKRPALIAAGILGPVVLLPPLALGLVIMLEPGGVTAMGLLLVASCPIGGISNAYSLLARAATALSVTLTGLSCIGAAVTIPLIAVLLERLHGRTVAAGVPVEALVTQLVLWLGVPVFLGMTLRRRAPEAALRWRGPIQRLSLALLLVLVLIIIAASNLVAHETGEMVLVAALFIVGSFALGWATGAVARADTPARFTLAAEFATRNMAVATLMAITLLGRMEFAIFGAIYLIVEIPLALLAIAVFRRMHRPPGLDDASLFRT